MPNSIYNLETVNKLIGDAFKSSAALQAEKDKLQTKQNACILSLPIYLATRENIKKTPLGGKGSKPVIGEAKKAFKADFELSDGTVNRNWNTQQKIRGDSRLEGMLSNPVEMLTYLKGCPWTNDAGVEKVGLSTFQELQEFLGMGTKRTFAQDLFAVCKKHGVDTIASLTKKLATKSVVDAFTPKVEEVEA